jgi:hypothetical protein
LGQLAEPVGHRHAPASSGPFPDVGLAVLEGPVGPAQLGSPEGEPQELGCVGLDPPALLRVAPRLSFWVRKRVTLSFPRSPARWLFTRITGSSAPRTKRWPVSDRQLP